MSPSTSPLPAPNTDLIASVFDALPLAAFVVDHDCNVIDFNLAGARLLDRIPFAVLRLRGGDQVQCIHSVEEANGAATAPCQDCIVKNFVREVFSHHTERRETGRLRLTTQGKADEVDFLITVAPIPGESEPLALLVLDDAAKLSGLLESMGRRPTPASSSPGSRARGTAHGRKKGSS